jgi:signal transduction histidine kinase
MDANPDTTKLTEEKDKLIQLCSVKADMVSISAHQIRTSLSAQKWIMKMFLDGDLGKLNTEQENLMRKAYESNDRAISVIKELLLANKTEEVVKEEYIFTKTDLMELINNTIFDFSGEAHALGIEIILLKPEGIKSFMVKADKEKLRIVLQNLLENAIKYSNMHGKIFISIVKDTDMMKVSIKDTGVGISEEGKKQIFEKFFRDKEAKKKEIIGSGIGLFTTKKIVESHGGKIWFDSRESEGTTFFFTIPIFK